MTFDSQFENRPPRVRLLLGAVCCLLALSLAALADEVHLKDGRVIIAEEVWETGDTVWYRQGKIIQSLAKAEVTRITKPKPAPKPAETAAAEPAAKSSTTAKEKSIIAAAPEPEKETAKSALVEGVETRKVSRIFLKGGVRIDADYVWESEDRVGYRLGKMQTFVDRAAVERVVHDLSIVEEKLPQGKLPLRYTTGHRGLDQLIAYNGEKHGVDPMLIYLVIREESRFNHRAVSRVGARGLMQLMPDTARRLGVRNIHNPIENVDGGTRYLRSLLEMFNGDLNLALAGYNAGENAVFRYGRRVPPYRETLNYVWRINTAYRRALADRQKEVKSDK
jgi:soluble lytic murein transglycosylase-like protein